MPRRRITSSPRSGELAAGAAASDPITKVAASGGHLRGASGSAGLAGLSRGQALSQARGHSRDRQQVQQLSGGPGQQPVPDRSHPQAQEHPGAAGRAGAAAPALTGSSVSDQVRLVCPRRDR